MQIPIEQIEQYKKTHKHSKLHFDDYRKDDDNLFTSETSVAEMVKSVLELSKWDCSYDSKGKLETKADCFRSSLDIWRHIIYFRPEITLIQVMRALYGLENNLDGQFCCDVFRLVFKYCEDSWDADLSTENGSEYGIPFEMWVDLPA